MVRLIPTFLQISNAKSFPSTIINNLPSFESATIPKFVSSYGQEINSVLIFVTLLDNNTLETKKFHGPYLPLPTSNNSNKIKLSYFHLAHLIDSDDSFFTVEGPELWVESCHTISIWQRAKEDMVTEVLAMMQNLNKSFKWFELNYMKTLLSKKL